MAHSEARQRAWSRQAAHARQRREAFAEDYRWLREQHISHDRIADRLGITREALLRRLQRAGAAYIPEPHERRALEVLEAAIATGRPFSSNDLPHIADHPTAISQAVRLGRIVRIGTVADLLAGNPVGVYITAATQGAAS